MDNSYDVDIVVMWVDGNDPAWLAEKRKYSGKTLAEDDAVTRYRDWELMKYWFRGIEKFIPWYHKIFFVTWGHVPPFLDTKNERLRIVKHSEFMPDEYLPTYNSSAIETNLHRIKDLSEHFILFNDDMLLLRPIQKEYFFQNGLPCSYYAETATIPLIHTGAYCNMLFNDTALVNRHFNKGTFLRKNLLKYFNIRYRLYHNIKSLLLFCVCPWALTGFYHFHTSAPYLKSVFEEVWKEEYEALDNTGRSQYRRSTDVNQHLFYLWQLVTGCFVPVRIDNYVTQVTDTSIDNIVECITKQTHKSVCLNDADVDDFDILKARLHNAFEQILPTPCSFEK